MSCSSRNVMKYDKVGGEKTSVSYKVKEVANIVGVSIRTLHHYDEIGLLTPKSISQQGIDFIPTTSWSDCNKFCFFSGNRVFTAGDQANFG